MAEKKNSIRWFLRELPVLREAGVIDDEALQSLRNHYKEKLSSCKGPREYFVFMLGILGVLMITGGIILAVAFNWDMFENIERITISAIPLILGFIWGVVALIRNNNRFEREGAAILSAGGIAVLFSMLSQIYHCGGEISDFMLVVLALSLPLIYIFDSMGVATFYVFGLFFIKGNTFSPLWNAFGIVAFLPYLLYHIFSPTKYRTWARYLACVVAISGMVNCSGCSTLFCCFSVATLGLLAGRELYERKTKMRRNPWMIPSFFFLLFLLGIAATNGEKAYMATQKCSSVEIANFWMFNGITLIMIMVSYLRRKLDIERFMTGLFILLLVPGFFPFGKKFVPYFEMTVFIYSVVFGIMLLCRGFRRNHFTIFNGGLLLVSSQFVIRFFNSDICALYRSAAFIVVGCGFVVANIFFARRIAKGGVR